MSFRTFITNSFTRKDREELELEAFPSLFSMQGHQGGCGLAFLVLWFALASKFAPDIWSKGGPALVLIAVAIGASYFGLLWLSFSAVNYLSRQINELRQPSPDNQATREKLDRRVRIWMTALSTIYALVCAALIWLTGGAISPFTPFYVMIFILTITQVQISYPGIGKSVLAYFLVVIVMACIVAEWSPGPIDNAVLRQSNFQALMHVLFISFALIVPTVSQYRVELREARAQKSASGGDKP